jgi:hypothetical protein
MVRVDPSGFAALTPTYGVGVGGVCAVGGLRRVWGVCVGVRFAHPDLPGRWEAGRSG